MCGTWSPQGVPISIFGGIRDSQLPDRFGKTTDLRARPDRWTPTDESNGPSSKRGRTTPGRTFHRTKNQGTGCCRHYWFLLPSSVLAAVHANVEVDHSIQYTLENKLTLLLGLDCPGDTMCASGSTCVNQGAQHCPHLATFGLGNCIE